jgi:hypothetical protein
MSLPPLLLPRAEPWEGSTRQGEGLPAPSPFRIRGGPLITELSMDISSPDFGWACRVS